MQFIRTAHYLLFWSVSDLVSMELRLYFTSSRIVNLLWLCLLTVLFSKIFCRNYFVKTIQTEMGINTPNRDEPSDNVGDLENLQQVIETNSQENNSETSEESSSSGSSESEKIVVKTNGKNGYLMRTESQIELEYIEANNPSGSQEDGIGEERLRSDLELLSRPSWCDAGFALSSVQKVRLLDLHFCSDALFH